MKGYLLGTCGNVAFVPFCLVCSGDVRAFLSGWDSFHGASLEREVGCRGWKFIP